MTGWVMQRRDASPPAPTVAVRPPTESALNALGWRVALVALFAGQAGVLAGGVLRAPADQVLGYDASGVWRVLWTFRWTWRGVSDLGALPVDAPTLNFPAGGPLWSPSWLLDVLSLPLQALAGAVVAYNILVLLHLVVAAVGASALARLSGRSRAAAVVAGTVFGFNTLLLTGGVAAARADVLAMAWLPWCFVAVKALVRRPGVATVTGAVVTWAMLVLGSMQWGLVASVFLPFVAVTAGLDAGKGSDRPAAIRMAVALLVAGALGALLFWGVLAWMGDVVHASGALDTRADLHAHTFPPALDMGHLGHRYANLFGWFYPGEAGLVVNEGLDLEVWSTYAGVLALTLATFGVRRGNFRWLGLGLGSAVLSLGPYLLVSLDSWRPVAVPWWIEIHRFFPWLLAVSDPVLFAGVAFVGLAVLAGAGLDVLLHRLAHPAARGVVALALSFAMIGETWYLSPAQIPFPSASTEHLHATEWLRTAPAGAVLDWPPRAAGRQSEVGRYLWEQVAHGRPIPYDLASTDDEPGALEANPFWGSLEVATYGADFVSPAWDSTTELPIARGLLELREMGYRWIVLHPALVAEGRRADVQDWLQAWTRPVVTLPDGDIVYDLRTRDRAAQRK